MNNKRDTLIAKAQQGDVAAQYYLGQLWEKGDAVNLVDAYFWYSLAAVHGHKKAADERDKVGKHLSVARRKDEDILVEKWKPTAPPSPPPHFHGDGNAEILIWLQSWYEFQFQACGGWEEGYFGVKIESMGNPGWSVKIDLAETSLEYKPFTEIKEDHGQDDWLTCRVKDRKYESFGDPSKLKKMLEIFRSWASEPFQDDNKERLEIIKTLVEFSGDLDEISERLKKFNWDYAGREFILSRAHITQVLNRYLKDEIDAQTVEKWADIIECREDIDFKTEDVLQVIHDLANPYLSQLLDKKWAEELIQMVPAVTEKK